MGAPLRDNVRPLRRPAGEITSPGRRLRANWPAQMRANGKRTGCTVVDVSSAGANLRVDTAPGAPGAQVWLVIENIGPIAAAIAWQEKGRLGVRFLEQQDWVSGLSKQRFDPAAWLGKS